MKHRISWIGVIGSFLAIVGVFLSAKACAAADTTAREHDYWPLDVGMSWVYVDQDQQRQTSSVIGRDVLDGRSVAVVEHRDAMDVIDRRSYCFTQDDGAVLLVAYQEVYDGQAASITRADPPYTVWPGHAAPGVRWQVPLGKSGLSERVIERTESVTVPAGTYLALAVVSTASSQDRTTTQWVAPGVGLVKSRTTWSPEQQRPAVGFELVRHTRSEHVPPP